MIIYLGKNIKYLRETKLRISKVALAEMIDIKSATVGKYETDDTRPSFEVLVKLYELFEVDLHSLVFRDITNEGIRTDEQEINPGKINILEELYELRKRMELLEARVAGL
jgi:predicted transcriptional regulator